METIFVPTFYEMPPTAAAAEWAGMAALAALAASAAAAAADATNTKMIPTQKNLTITILPIFVAHR